MNVSNKKERRPKGRRSRRRGQAAEIFHGADDQRNGAQNIILGNGIGEGETDGGAGAAGGRTDCLRLERLDRPVLAHFPGNDAFDIVLEIHHVDDIDVPAAHALVFKAAVVAIAGEPRHRWCRSR